MTRAPSPRTALLLDPTIPPCGDELVDTRLTLALQVAEAITPAGLNQSGRVL